MKKLSKRLLSVLLSVLMVCTVMPFGAFTAHADALSDAKEAYINKINNMANGTVYTNLLPAYQAYVAACEQNAGAEEAAALQTAVGNMQVFTTYTGDFQKAYFNGTEATGYYGNVLYSVNPVDLQYADMTHGYEYQHTGLLDYSDDVWVHQNGGLLLYDGVNAAMLPAFFAEQCNEGKWGFRYDYVAETGDRLNAYWQGYDNISRTGSFDVTAAWPSSSTDYISSDVTSTTYIFDSATHDSTSSFYNFKNALTFTLDDNTLYKKYSKFEFKIGAYWRNLVTGTEHLAEGDSSLVTTNTVYVLNYKMLLNKMQSCIASDAGQGFLDTNGMFFAKGDSTGFFACFDNATTLAFTDEKYGFSTDLEEGFKAAYLDLNEAINDFDEIKSTNGSFAAIVRCIQDYEGMMAKNPYRKNLASTYRYYLKAKEAFDAYVFGQKNDKVADADFLADLDVLATDFRNALNSSTPFATKNETTGEFEAIEINSDLTKLAGNKFFVDDSYEVETAVTKHSAYETMNNILYFPTTDRDNGQRALTEPHGDYSGSYKQAGGANYYWNGRVGDGSNHFTIYYPENMVLLYNGNSDPVFPVMCGVRNNHGSWGSENYGFAAYPTDSETLNDSNNYTYYAAFSSATTLTDLASKKAPAVSANFSIKSHSDTFTFNSCSSNTYWKGLYRDNTNTEFNLNWFASWEQSETAISGYGAMYGSPDETWYTDYRLKADDNHARNEIAVAATAVEFTANNDFASTTDKSGNTEYVFAKQYDAPNWYHAWRESTGSSDYAEVLLGNGTIDVLNVKPMMDVQNKFIATQSAQSLQDILSYIYEYDKDSQDVLSLMEEIDAVQAKIGSFNPNDPKYDYSATTAGTPVYSTNAGVEEASKDMAALIPQIEENVDAIDAIINYDSEGAAGSADVNGLNPPTETEKGTPSTSVSTDASSLETGYWYNDLRAALLNPLTSDSCTDTTSEYYTNYMSALDTAQSFISAKALGNTTEDFPEVYDNKKIEDVIKALKDAAAKFDKANTNHSYLYADEDADQLSDWECRHNAVHTHGTADMSAYNELEIAYNTIDEKAYEAAAEADMEAAYEDFKDIKTEPTEHGQTPQNYVDNGVIELLTAINTAATGGTSGDSQLNFYNVNFNVVIDGDEENPVKVMKNQAMSYGTTNTFDATDAAGFPTDSTCYKWTVQQDNEAAQTIYHTSNTLANFIQANTTVTAYVNSATPEEKVNVMIYGPTKMKLYDINIRKDATVNFGTVDANGNLTVTIDGKDYKIASTPAYRNTEWTIGVEQNSDVYEGTSGNGIETYTVEALREKYGLSYLKLYPHFTQVVTNNYTVTASGNTDATIIVNGEDKEAKSVSGVVYDDKVTITYDIDNLPTDPNAEGYKGEFYGIAINISEMAGGTTARYVPISYSNEFYFRANSIMNVYPIYKTVVQKGESTANVYTVDDASQTKITNPTDRYYLNRHLPFVVDQFDKTNVAGKYVFRVMFTQNIPEDAGVKITENGYTFLRLNSAELVDAISAGESDIVYGKDWTINGTKYGVVQKASSKGYDEKSHQFSFSTTVPSGYAYQASRGYVKFTYDFTQEIVDANETVTVDAPIEGITYGRADFYINQ